MQRLKILLCGHFVLVLIGLSVVKVIFFGEIVFKVYPL